MPNASWYLNVTAKTKILCVIKVEDTSNLLSGEKQWSFLTITFAIRLTTLQQTDT